MLGDEEDVGKVIMITNSNILLLLLSTFSKHLQSFLISYGDQAPSDRLPRNPQAHLKSCHTSTCSSTFALLSLLFCFQSVSIFIFMLFDLVNELLLNTKLIKLIEKFNYKCILLIILYICDFSSYCFNACMST